MGSGNGDLRGLGFLIGIYRFIIKILSLILLGVGIYLMWDGIKGILKL